MSGQPNSIAFIKAFLCWARNDESFHDEEKAHLEKMTKRDAVDRDFSDAPESFRELLWQLAFRGREEATSEKLNEVILTIESALKKNHEGLYYDYFKGVSFTLHGIIASREAEAERVAAEREAVLAERRAAEEARIARERDERSKEREERLARAAVEREKKSASALAERERKKAEKAKRIGDWRGFVEWLEMISTELEAIIPPEKKERFSLPEKKAGASADELLPLCDQTVGYLDRIEFYISIPKPEALERSSVISRKLLDKEFQERLFALLNNIFIRTSEMAVSASKYSLCEAATRCALFVFDYLITFHDRDNNKWYDLMKNFARLTSFQCLLPKEGEFVREKKVAGEVTGLTITPGPIFRVHALAFNVLNSDPELSTVNRILDSKCRALKMKYEC